MQSDLNYLVLPVLQKAILDKNYICFTYENQSFKNVKPLKLDSENREVESSLAEEFADENNLLFIEASF